MIELIDGNITADSQVVLTPKRTPLEFLGSLLKLWCPSEGVGYYASGTAMLSDLMTTVQNNMIPFLASTVAGTNTLTLNNVGLYAQTRSTINSISRFIASGGGTSFLFNSTWMNEGVYPTTQTLANIYWSYISQLNDKSGNGNHLTQATLEYSPQLLLNNNKITSNLDGYQKYMNVPLNLLNNQSKILFGIKAYNFSITTTENYIFRSSNNTGASERLTISVQQVSGKKYMYLFWNNGGTTYSGSILINNSTTFQLVIYADFPSQLIYVLVNGLKTILFSPTSSAFENLNANTSFIFGGNLNGQCVVSARYHDPVFAVGSGLSLAHFYELYDYYNYI